MPKSKSHHSRSQAAASSTAGSRSVKPDDATIMSTKERVDEIHERTTRVDEEELALKRKIVPRLAKRAYHLEDGNTWFQDWKQYQKNTHPVFGLCMYHRFHPIRLPQRIIILVGSIAFGFAITNCVYLGFLGHARAGGTVNIVYDATGRLAKAQEHYTNIELQQSLVFLMTVGSFTHSMFDMLIWYLMACFCFRPGGKFKVNKLCQNFGIYAAVLVVMLAVVAATSVAVVRFSEGGEQSNSQQEDYEPSMALQFAEDVTGESVTVSENGDVEDQSSSNKFSFLAGYALELVFALFVFYFITSTVFFSGILGCGRLPVVGGRPYEIRRAKSGADQTEDDDDGKDDEDGVGMLAYV